MKLKTNNNFITTNMKNLLLSIGFFIFISLLVILGKAFVNWQINPGLWHEAGRFGVVMLIGLIILPCSVVLYLALEDKI